MNTRAMSRRTLLEVGVSAVVGTAGVPALTIAHAETEISANCEVTVRKYYTAWEQKDWEPFDRLLADSFTFTSANNDDHISKGEFKKRCWDTQAEFISHFDLLHVFGHDNEAFVMYVGHTKNGKLFRNVEYVRVQADQLAAIECYFGAYSSFASAVAVGPK
jgi:hypothetical protein